MSTIVRDEDVRSGSPRIDGTRITVLDVKRRVIDAGEDPHVVAGEYELSMSQLFSALVYYYEHRSEFERAERDAAMARRDGERRTRELLEDVTDTQRDAQERAD